MALSPVEGLSCYHMVFDQGLHVRAGQACAGLGGDVFSSGMYNSYRFFGRYSGVKYVLSSPVFFPERCPYMVRA